MHKKFEKRFVKYGNKKDGKDGVRKKSSGCELKKIEKVCVSLVLAWDYPLEPLLRLFWY